VKAGQKISKNTILAEGSNVKEGTISNGLNVLCVFMPWFGYNFEDGMVVSESLAKRFISVHLQDESVYLTEDEDVVHIASVGEDFKKGSIVFSYTNAVYDVESFKHLRTDGGKIVNIEVYSNLEEDKIPEKLMPAYKETVRMTEATKGKYSLGTFREKGEKFEGILVKFTIEQTVGLYVGDKLNNRAFNKGLISIVEKDENMPFIPELGKHADMVYNQLSVINRMNTGQLSELHTGLISHRLAEFMETNSKDIFLKLFKTSVTNSFEYRDTYSSFFSPKRP
jgi:DNA-directed RNA polymerase subunit beta